MRSSTILFHLTHHLLYNKYRDPGEEPKLHLFGQLKRITRQWLDGGYLRCSGGTFPAQLSTEIADMAAERIKAAITETLAGDNRSRRSSTLTTRPARPPTSISPLRRRRAGRPIPPQCHVNWVVCDSDWEAEFCRVAEAHPRVRAYVKNQNLGFEVPYLMGVDAAQIPPDFIVQVDDGDARSAQSHR